MTVEPFKAADYHEIVPRSPEEIEALGETQWRELLERYERNPSWTMRDESGRVVFFGGVVVLWKGVGEAWSVMSDLVEHFPLAVVREIRRRIDETFEEKRLRRIQAIIADDNPRAVKLMRLAGFEVEGLLRAYSPDGKDCFILGRVKEWKS
mgnify:CR=1 FL=1